MSLSEREKRIFAEIEQQLTEEDPRFVDKARRRTPEGRRGRRLKLAAAAVVLGFFLLLGIVVEGIGQVLGLVGFMLMFVGVVVGVRELQTVQGDLGQRVRALLEREPGDG